jgi:hypothetical protein
MTEDVTFNAAKGGIVKQEVFMRFFEIRRTILAPPEKIWAILTDPAQLMQGFGIQRIVGQITLGGRIKLWSDAAPGRPFPLRVIEMTKPRRMVWQGGMPLGLFTGTRVYSLAVLTEGQTDFTMREDYTGLLAPMIFPKLPDLNPSFRSFADGLQKAAET